MNKIDNLNTVFRRISKDFSFKYIFLILCIELSTNDHFGKLKLLLSLLGLLPHVPREFSLLFVTSITKTNNDSNKYKEQSKGSTCENDCEGEGVDHIIAIVFLDRVQNVIPSVVF